MADTPAEIHARIELAFKDGALDASIETVSDGDNPACVLAQFLARHINNIAQIAMLENEQTRGAVEAATKVSLMSATPRLVGADGKLVS